MKGAQDMPYQNPILKGDYADPDVIRVGNDYYMIASSFTYFPGIPLLHSVDLVHWEQINAVARNLPFGAYRRPRHKRGLWAPSIRYHNGLFYVYVCTPDEGLLVYYGADPRGEFRVRHIKDAAGWIDPCPLWDDDGQAYLLHGFAGSRAGIKSRLYLHRMRPDGLSILDDGIEVFAGGEENPTTEGPKMYKIGGYYWILCPAGGVTQGWQLAMRSQSPYGPYEARRVLAQGDTPINGPHQGGLVDTPGGQWWFIHFQDRGVYGRVPHLQPVHWQDGFPVMGEGGKPVLQCAMPDTGAQSDVHIATSDDFAGLRLALQWQWQAHEDTAWYRLLQPGLRLYARGAESLFMAGQFLSQLMQSFASRWTVRLRADFDQSGDRAGMAVMGYAYHYACLTPGALAVYAGVAREGGRRGNDSAREDCVWQMPYAKNEVTLALEIRDGMAAFAYESAEGQFVPMGEPVPLSAGGWMGARPGIFCANMEGQASGGWADFTSVCIEDLDEE